MPQTPLDIVEHARHQLFRDSRLTLGDIRVDQHQDTIRIRGAVLDRQAADGFMHALRVQAPGVNWRDELTPLVTGPDYGWALNLRAVADLRREADNFSERVSQTLYGEPIEVLRYQDDWAFVRLIDGYLGWMHVEPLHMCTMEAAQTYRQQITHTIKRPLTPLYAQPTAEPHEQVALLPFGARLAVEGHDGPMQRIRCPDGKLRWVASTDLIPQGEIPHGTTSALRTVEPWLHALIGVPYLWGGKTPFGYDCSGLVQMIYSLIGIHLRRDADQQALEGMPVAFDALEFGDLIFFDTRQSNADIISGAPDLAVTHVGMALNRTDFIHSSWRGGGVIWGSFDPQSPFFMPTFDRRFLGARRYLKANE
ncbi:MAG TPA: C40 family peptidase [Herpetosiphonaceae bacterium]